MNCVFWLWLRGKKVRGSLYQESSGLCCGGVYVTRTRDPLRDRQVF